jgi:transmembrane sensor
MTQDADAAMPIAEQAAHWWVVFHEAGASATDHREFGEWVARSPERVEAYLRVAQLHQALKSPAMWPDTPADELIRAAKTAPQGVAQLPRANVVDLEARRRTVTKPRALLAVGLAAAVLLSVGTAWLMLARSQQFQTRFGEQRSVLLEDGSRVTLNSASKIEVRVRADHRFVRLIQGEALFEVAHDAARPFDVSAGNAVLRAVGTQFDVDKRATHTTVTVVEGIVSVIAGTGRSGETPTLRASDRLVITAEGANALQHGINVAAAMAWTQHQLIFEHRPLGEIAEEFNRYNRGKIQIADEALRQQEMTGVFQSGDAASFLEFLSSVPGARIRDDGEGGHIVSVDDKSPAGK